MSLVDLKSNLANWKPVKNVAVAQQGPEITVAKTHQMDLDAKSSPLGVIANPSEVTVQPTVQINQKLKTIDKTSPVEITKSSPVTTQPSVTIADNVNKTPITDAGSTIKVSQVSGLKNESSNIAIKPTQVKDLSNQTNSIKLDTPTANIAFSSPEVNKNMPVVQFTTPILQDNIKPITFITPTLQSNISDSIKFTTATINTKLKAPNFKSTIKIVPTKVQEFSSNINVNPFGVQDFKSNIGINPFGVQEFSSNIGVNPFGVQNFTSNINVNPFGVQSFASNIGVNPIGVFQHTSNIGVNPLGVFQHTSNIGVTNFGVHNQTVPTIYQTPPNAKVDYQKNIYALSSLQSSLTVPVKGFTLKQSVTEFKMPNFSSLLKPVNYFDDNFTGAKGFSLYFNNPNDSKFVGVSGDKYTYPSLVRGNRLFNVPTANSKYNTPTATLETQVNSRSTFLYTDKEILKSKPFTSLGYSQGNKYGDAVKSVRNQSDKSLLYVKSTETNSPSALELQYGKFNLQDDSFNPFWITSPLVLRGIQRKDKKEPQRWGIGGVIDDGLIRGGATVAAERAGVDAGRIAQWIASPKGLLWVAKQVGLQLSNPKTENRISTRVYNPLVDIANVATAPFGIHTPRHGLLTVGTDAFNYENVVKSKNIIGGNRLVTLKKELFLQSTIANKLTTGLFKGLSGLSSFLSGVANSAIGGFLAGGAASNAAALVNSAVAIKAQNALAGIGLPIVTLSGPNGPDSVYGIGSTTIRRWSNTRPAGQTSYYDYGNPYLGTNNWDADSLVSRFISSVTGFGSSAKVSVYRAFFTNSDEEWGTMGSNNNSTFADPNHGLHENGLSYTNIGSSENESIDVYATTAYDIIPKSAARRVIYEDFRSDIKNNTGATKTTLRHIGIPKNDTWRQDNIIKKGYGDPGKTNVDRSEPTGEKSMTNSERADKINLSGFKSGNPKDVSDVYKDSDTRDFIDFWFAGPNSAEDHIIPFRANIQGFTDDFSATWNNIPIMGRPEGAYRYQAFDRTVSFTFTVAATSRSEMKPLWQKLNYLATYTMPVYAGNTNKGIASGTFLRLTLGNLFRNTPILLESLSYSIPDESAWDIALDRDTNKEAKQLPMMIDANVSLKVIGDWKPAQQGRAYSLSQAGAQGSGGDWLDQSIFK